MLYLLWSREGIEHADVGALGFVPADSKVLDGQASANLANLFIGLIGADKVVEGKDYAGGIPEPLGAQVHGCPEASVESGRDPCCTEVGSSIEISEWLRTLESD